MNHYLKQTSSYVAKIDLNFSAVPSLITYNTTYVETFSMVVNSYGKFFSFLPQY